MERTNVTSIQLELDFFDFILCGFAVLSTRLLKSQSADSLLNSNMDTASPPAAPADHAWMDGLSQRSKDMDAASSSAASNRHSPQTHDAFLSLLTNKGLLLARISLNAALTAAKAQMLTKVGGGKSEIMKSEFYIFRLNQKPAEDLQKLT